MRLRTLEAIRWCRFAQRNDQGKTEKVCGKKFLIVKTDILQQCNGYRLLILVRVETGVGVCFDGLTVHRL